MIIVLRSREKASDVEKILLDNELSYRRLVLYNRDVIVAWGKQEKHAAEILEKHPAVELVTCIGCKLQLVSREWRRDKTVFQIGGVPVGRDFVIIAGPCSVESREQMIEVAHAVAKSGAHVLRGGVWKPRTSPYSFQGLGEEGLKLLTEAAREAGLPAITEVMDPRFARKAFSVVDGVWVGARSMQSTPLLRELGTLCANTGKPVLIKRGFGNTIDEWLYSAEYVMLEGCASVGLIERGSRCWHSVSRFSFDPAVIPVVKARTHLPVIVDPSHPAGNRNLVEPLALAAVVAGADGLMIEVHPWPEKALSDSKQQLTPDEFRRLVERVKLVLEVLGGRLAKPSKRGI